MFPLTTSFVFYAQLLGVTLHAFAAPATSSISRRMGGGIISCYWPGMGKGRYGCYEVSQDQKITGITYNIYRWVDVDASDVHLEYLNTALDDVSGEYTSMLQGNDLTVTFYVVDTPT
jgi:hypothetical protein